MATDNIARAFIPDDRLNITELLNGAAQLFIFSITGFKVFSRIVC